MSRPIDIDELTSSITAFANFSELTNAQGNYRPTLLARHGEQYVQLADAYDAHMESVGDERRAYRGVADPQRLLEERQRKAVEAAVSTPTILSVRLTRVCPHGKPSNTCCGYAEWLQVIHAINAERTGWIGAPLSSYDWWARGWCEDYEDFRVILGAEGDDNRNYVQAKTPEAAEALRRAVKTVVGITVDANGMAV